MVDTTVVVIANLVNLLMIGIFLARVRRRKDVERRFGVVILVLAIPVLAAAVHNVQTHRSMWFTLLLLPFLFHCLIEWLLDYVWKLDFRSTWLVGPYLLVYYLGLLGLIGYAFLVSRVAGFVTLATYFLNQLATWYSYARVGHGQADVEGSLRET
ncbi:MAG: hypothetical protein R6W76_17985 [Caldilinea sp.]